MKLQRSIDKTKKEEQTKVDKKKETKQSSEKLKKLEESLANLPKWPHYAELDDVTQFDKTKFDAAVLLVTEALAIRSNLEASIKKKVNYIIDNYLFNDACIFNFLFQLAF